MSQIAPQHITGPRTTLLGHTLPEEWVCVERHGQDAAYDHQLGNLHVIESIRREQDRRRWLHVSISRKGSLPTWDDLHVLKAVWIGKERTAIQVFPPEQQYVNFHPHCLHLFACLETKPVLPDFTRGIINPLEPGKRAI